MIANPVMFGKSGAKTVEVTIGSGGVFYCYLDVNGEYQQKYTPGSENAVVEMRAGNMFAAGTSNGVLSGATYVGAYTRGPYFWKVNDA